MPKKIFRVELASTQTYFIDVEATTAKDAKLMAQSAADYDPDSLPLYTEPFYSEGYIAKEVYEIQPTEQRNGMDELISADAEYQTNK